ncbi:hypothetical protein OG568_46340 [Streptomyces sp. NBC_01450]|uniref:hypothetical protein n=1 Tax=Streptomyces sp. NBC_01450 TaxID=2903871 RepID=UPI002E333276|nr:hypothetical protein [Streptomyces sp. NBC_01450]
MTGVDPQRPVPEVCGGGGLGRRLGPVRQRDPVQHETATVPSVNVVQDLAQDLVDGFKLVLVGSGVRTGVCATCHLKLKAPSATGSR